MGTRSLLCLAPLLLVLPACYSYVAVATPELPRGSRVRADFSEPQDVRLSGIQQQTYHGVVRVGGEVVSTDTARLVLSAFELKSNFGQEVLASGETVTLPREAIATLKQKRFSLGRTAAFTAAIGLFGLLVEQTFGVLGGGGEGPGPGNPRPK